VTAPDNGAGRVMSCMCIVSDEDGGSRFVMYDLDVAALVPAPGLPAISTSDTLPATGIEFMQIPARDGGAPMPWHPAPGPRLIICLAGTSQQETSDGDVRRFIAGEYFLTVDMTGKGHRSTNFGDTSYAIVHLDRDPTA
jgi:hypothetical protein